MTAAANSGFEARRILTKRLNEDGDAVGNVAKNVNVIIPLNRYSFFEELFNRMLIPMQLEINIELQNDAELIYKNAAAAAGRVVVKKFLLWVPKMIPKDTLCDKFVATFMTKQYWTYKREMYASSSTPTHNSGFFQISPSIGNVHAVFVYLQRNKTNVETENPHHFDTFKLDSADNAIDNLRTLTNCRLEYGNGIFYPETEYDSESKVSIYNNLMSYGMRKNNYNSGTQLNLANHNSPYSLIYFDLSFQTEKGTRDPKQLIFRYRINGTTANADAFRVHAIVLYNEEIVIDMVGNELVIV